MAHFMKQYLIQLEWSYVSLISCVAKKATYFDDFEWLPTW